MGRETRAYYVRWNIMAINKISLSQALAEVDALPPLSEVFHKELELTSQENASRADLVRCISLDQAISAKVLQTINSAYFGMGQKVSSLDIAVGLLGDNNIRDIAIMCSASASMRKSIAGYGMLADQFWLHSVTTAFAARLIADKCDAEERETAFAAGLLHDIGMVVMDQIIQNSQIKMIWDDEMDIFPDYYSMENEIFGFTHCRIGYFISRNWNFPDNLTAAIAFHHMPESDTDHRELVRIVSFANVLAHLVSMGVMEPRIVVLLGEEGGIPFDFSCNDIEENFTRLVAEVEDSKAFLG